MRSTIILKNDNYLSPKKSKELINKKILICAKRGSGKSFLLRQLHSNMITPDSNSFSITSKFHKIDIVSPTEQINQFHETNFPTANIKYRLTPEVLDELNQSDESNDLCFEEKKSLIILDDCIRSKYDAETLNGLKKLLLKKNATIFVVCQYPIFPCDFVKAMFDYLIISYEDFHCVKNRLFRYISNISPNDKESVFNLTISSLCDFAFMQVTNIKKKKKELRKNKKKQKLEQTKQIGNETNHNLSQFIFSDPNPVIITETMIPSPEFNFSTDTDSTSNNTRMPIPLVNPFSFSFAKKNDDRFNDKSNDSANDSDNDFEDDIINGDKPNAIKEIVKNENKDIKDKIEIQPTTEPYPYDYDQSSLSIKPFSPFTPFPSFTGVPSYPTYPTYPTYSTYSLDSSYPSQSSFPDKEEKYCTNDGMISGMTCDLTGTSTLTNNESFNISAIKLQLARVRSEISILESMLDSVYDTNL